MERPSIKSLLLKIGAILVFIAIILVSMSLIYNEKLYCKMLNSNTTYDLQELTLLDETNNYEFNVVWKYSEHKTKPISKVENSYTYYYVEHYCFLRSEYCLVFE